MKIKLKSKIYLVTRGEGDSEERILADYKQSGEIEFKILRVLPKSNFPEAVIKALMFANSPISNSLLSLDGKTIPVTFHVSKFEPKINVDLSNDC